VTQQALSVLYIVDMAEIPTFQELTRLDADGDGRLSRMEVNTFLQARSRDLTGGLTAALNGVVLPWRIESAELAGPMQTMTEQPVRSASGVALSPTTSLPTMRIVMRLTATFPDEVCRSCSLMYEDSNFPDRTGWKEIVGEAVDRVRLIRTSVSPQDVSRQLTLYPPEAIPPQDLRAQLVFDRGAARREEYAWVAIATTLLILLFGWRRVETVRVRRGWFRTQKFDA
jgi:hypothetical protein